MSKRMTNPNRPPDITFRCRWLMDEFAYEIPTANIESMGRWGKGVWGKPGFAVWMRVKEK